MRKVERRRDSRPPTEWKPCVRCGDRSHSGVCWRCRPHKAKASQAKAPAPVPPPCCRWCFTADPAARILPWAGDPSVLACQDCRDGQARRAKASRLCYGERGGPFADESAVERRCVRGLERKVYPVSRGAA